jgi:hypothetical protein
MWIGCSTPLATPHCPEVGFLYSHAGKLLSNQEPEKSLFPHLPPDFLGANYAVEHHL